MRFLLKPIFFQLHDNILVVRLDLFLGTLAVVILLAFLLCRLCLLRLSGEIIQGFAERLTFTQALQQGSFQVNVLCAGKCAFLLASFHTVAQLINKLLTLRQLLFKHLLAELLLHLLQLLSHGILCFLYSLVNIRRRNGVVAQFGLAVGMQGIEQAFHINLFNNSLLLLVFSLLVLNLEVF